MCNISNIKTLQLQFSEIFCILKAHFAGPTTYTGETGKYWASPTFLDKIERVGIYQAFPDYIDIDFDIEKSELILKVNPNNTGEVMISRLYLDTQGMTTTLVVITVVGMGFTRIII